MKGLKVIGWREWIALPDFGLKKLKVKVDSGARTSALHASRVKYINKANGDHIVSFLVHTNKIPDEVVKVEAPLVGQRKVRSSTGHVSLRPVVRTHIALGGEVWSTEITLVNRDPMGFRMLLGRQALRGRFLINPSRSFILSKGRS